MAKKVSEVEVIRIPELPEAIAKPAASYVVIYNPEDGKTYRILESLLQGGQTTVPNWTSGATFDTGELCIFNLKIWSSKVDGNIGQTPIEGAFWEEVSKSEAGYTPVWAAGVYDVALSQVVKYDSVSDKYILYILRASAPFTSSDFDTELSAGSWQAMGGSGGSVTPATNQQMQEATNNTATVTPLQFLYGLGNTVVSALATTAKNIIGAINELFIALNLKGEAHPSWAAWTVPTANDIIIDEVAGTLTFGTINGAPISASNKVIYFIDLNGRATRFEITAPVVMPFNKTDGVKWFYFNASGANVIDSATPPTFGAMAPLYRAYWDESINGFNTRAAEFHPNTQSAAEHDWKHTSFGTVWLSGFNDVSNPLTSGAPNASGINTCIGLTGGSNMDDNFQYSIANNTSGAKWSQDLGTNTAANLTTTNGALLKISYNDSLGKLRLLPATRFPFDFTGNVPNFITGAGVRTPITNNYFFVYFEYVLQDDKAGEAVRLRSYTQQFQTIDLARNAQWEDLVSQSPTLGDKEIRPLRRRIWEYRTAYPTAVKGAVLRETLDIRKERVNAITVSSSTILSTNVALATVPSGSTASNQDVLNIAEYSHSRIYNGQFSFSGITTFKIKYQRPLTITSVQKAVTITDFRAGKNGVTPTTMTFPYVIAVGDIIEYAATYDQYTDSYFTLIGNYTD